MLVASGLSGIVATAGLASRWAEDLPRTRAFAIEHEPFGDRSLLRPAAARDALARVLRLVPERARVVSLTREPERLIVHVRDGEGRRRWYAAGVGGATDGHRTDLPERGRGAAPVRMASLDLVGPLRAARERWEALGRPGPPMLRLTAVDGRLRAWGISFAAASAEEREIEVDPDGRSPR